MGTAQLEGPLVLNKLVLKIDPELLKSNVEAELNLEPSDLSWRAINWGFGK